MKNEKYISLRKKVPVLFFGCYLMFCCWGCYDCIEYISYKADYILVEGVIEEFVHVDGGRMGDDYSILRVKINDLSYKVRARRRFKDQIGKVVRIAINPSEDKGGYKKGVWIEPFLAYQTVLLLISIIIGAVLYLGISRGAKVLNKMKFR